MKRECRKNYDTREQRYLVIVAGLIPYRATTSSLLISVVKEDKRAALFCCKYLKQLRKSFLQRFHDDQNVRGGGAKNVTTLGNLVKSYPDIYRDALTEIIAVMTPNA